MIHMKYQALIFLNIESSGNKILLFSIYIGVIHALKVMVIIICDFFHFLSYLELSMRYMSHSTVLFYIYSEEKV